MKNFLTRLSYKFQSFMSGRYGIDKLYNVLLILFLVLNVIASFIRKPIAVRYGLWALGTAVLVYMLFRVFSKNIQARERENAVILNIERKVRENAAYQKEKRDCKNTNVFRVCPNCKARLKLPKIKGNHTVECPRCHKDFSVKVR